MSTFPMLQLRQIKFDAVCQETERNSTTQGLDRMARFVSPANWVIFISAECLAVLAIPSFFEIKESDWVGDLSDKNRICFF